MVRIVGILVALCFGHPVDDPISMKGWRGIQPLHSSRADVEKLLGPPADKPDCDLCTYHLTDVSVLFHYSRGECKSGLGAWDVPADTVIYITIHPKPKTQHWSNLAIDKAKFKVGSGGHTVYLVSYLNEEDGLLVEVDNARDEVMGFYYLPAAKDKGLRCP